MSAVVSIIVPVYNSEKYLPDCVESLVNQSYKNIEILLVNDGSTDGSLMLCQKYQNKDHRIVVINSRHGGVSVARNLGIIKATGEYLAFVDSDDMVSENYIERLVEPVLKHSIFLSLCQYKGFYAKAELTHMALINNDITIIDNNKRIIRNLYEDFCELCVPKGLLYGPCGKIYRRNIIICNHIFFDENLVNGEDQVFNFSYFCFGQHYAYIKSPLYFYRCRQGSLSKTFSQKSLDGLYFARSKLIEFLERYNVPKKEFIINSHCNTDLSEYLSIDGAGFFEYRKRAVKAKSYISDYSAAFSFKRRLILLMLKYSMYFPIYLYYRLKNIKHKI